MSKGEIDTDTQEKNQPHTAASACAKNAGSAGV
jgi:hypothetical protein